MTEPVEKFPIEPSPSHAPELARRMGLGALIIYGVGNMLGAGIYGLIGVAARDMGNMIWLAFLASMIAAMCTGLSYASLGSRYPRAAGAAYVTHRAFRLSMLSYVLGLALVASGLISMGASSRVFADYFQNYVDAPSWIIVIAFIGVLTLVNFWGIRESTWMNLICTLAEVSGLALVIVVGARYWGSADLLDARSVNNPGGELTIAFVLNGAVLTFYAFIGFEDMINVTEEVKDVRRTFPRGVVIAVLITTLVYMAVGITAVSVVPSAQLAGEAGSVVQGSGPLVKVVAVAAPWMPPKLFAAIALFAVTNTALLNYVTGSRLIYGMSRQGLLPAVLGRVHPTRRTPHVAIGVLLVIVLTLALSGGLSALASASSLLLLIIFVVVNLSLVILKNRPGEERGELEIPIIVPIAGIIICSSMIAGALWSAPTSQSGWRPLIMVGGVLVVGAMLYFVVRPRRVIAETGAAGPG
jgi:amino acid transporter